MGNCSLRFDVSFYTHIRCSVLSVSLPQNFDQYRYFNAFENRAIEMELTLILQTNAAMLWLEEDQICRSTYEHERIFQTNPVATSEITNMLQVCMSIFPWKCGPSWTCSAIQPKENSPVYNALPAPKYVTPRPPTCTYFTSIARSAFTFAFTGISL